MQRLRAARGGAGGNDGGDSSGVGAAAVAAQTGADSLEPDQTTAAERTAAETLAALDGADISMFHFKAIVIAGAGFFTDAYDLFSIGLLTRVIGRLYYQDDPYEMADYVSPGALPINIEAAVSGVALCGTLAGQLLFGRLGDLFGRKAVYGLVLTIMILSAICQSLSFGRSATAVIGTLCFFRFFLGLGVGGDYPLSAIIMSEYSSRKTRGAFVSAVFAQQGTGILVSIVVSSALRAAYPGGPFPDKTLVLAGMPPSARGPDGRLQPSLGYASAPEVCPSAVSASDQGSWTRNPANAGLPPLRSYGRASFCDPARYGGVPVLCPHRLDLTSSFFAAACAPGAFRIELAQRCMLAAPPPNAPSAVGADACRWFWGNCTAAVAPAAAPPLAAALAATAPYLNLGAAAGCVNYATYFLDGTPRVSVETGAPRVMAFAESPLRQRLLAGGNGSSAAAYASGAYEEAVAAPAPGGGATLARLPGRVLSTAPALSAAAQQHYYRMADYLWRIVLLFGFFPAACTMYLRSTFPETPRYTLHVAGDAARMTSDMAAVMQTADAHAPLPPPPPAAYAPARLPVRLFLRRYGSQLLGCAACWFLLDVAFYSQGLFQKDVFTAAGWIPSASSMNAMEETFRIARAQALISLGSTVPGYWATVLTVDRLGRRNIQVAGFLLMTAFMAAAAGAYDSLLDRSGGRWTETVQRTSVRVNGFVVLYALTFFFSNWGPNATTFVIPAELFPAEWKSTAHGIAAAAGKAGAIVGAFGFLYASKPRRGELTWQPNYGGAWAWTQRPNCPPGMSAKAAAGSIGNASSYAWGPCECHPGSVILRNATSGLLAGQLPELNGTEVAAVPLPAGLQATGVLPWAPPPCGAVYDSDLPRGAFRECYGFGLGLRLALAILACTNFCGMCFTALLPETAGRSLEELAEATGAGGGGGGAEAAGAAPKEGEAQGEEGKSAWRDAAAAEAAGALCVVNVVPTLGGNASAMSASQYVV